jgi:hypothetical protein
MCCFFSGLEFLGRFLFVHKAPVLSVVKVFSPSRHGAKLCETPTRLMGSGSLWLKNFIAKCQSFTRIFAKRIETPSRQIFSGSLWLKLSRHAL